MPENPSTIVSKSAEALPSIILDTRPDHKAPVGGGNRTMLPAIDVRHILALTDETGIFQHAVFSIPNYCEGYTTDDNARAVMLATLVENLQTDDAEDLERFAPRYLAMLWFAFNPANGRFRNILSYNRVWQEDAGSEDSHGRALMSLGIVAAKSNFEERWGFAERLFNLALPAALHFTSPRAWAFTIIGISQYLKRFPQNAKAQAMLEALADRLYEMYKSVSSPEWQWFENIVSYSNARLSQGLLLAGDILDRADMTRCGLESLAWLGRIQRSKEGFYSPVGSEGFYLRHGERPQFDQQPLEAWTMVAACYDAYRFTKDTAWKDEATRTFRWFLGDNDVGIPLYDPKTGGCFDGLHNDRVNGNLGSESTLSFLLSLVEMHMMQGL